MVTINRFTCCPTAPVPHARYVALVLGTGCRERFPEYDAAERRACELAKATRKPVSVYLAAGRRTRPLAAVSAA